MTDPTPPSRTHPDAEPVDALARVALRMASVLDLGELLGTITDGLVAEFDAALARIWLLESPPRLVLRASSGLSRSLGGRYREVALGALKIGAIAAERERVCVDDPERDPRIADPAWVRAHALRTFAGYPLMFRGELLGVLALFTRRRLEPGEFDRVGVFASQAAVAIKNARLFTALDALAARLSRENEYLREEVRDARAVPARAVGESAAWRAVVEGARQVAPTDATVLITGETGTGKELLARAIHEWSPRRERALVRMNCAAVPALLLESELFGHEKGSFTGASGRRIGRFELADGGTLFLDEVGELSLDAQAAMLRVLQEREFERVGGNAPVRVDVRVVAATNRDLEAEVSAGRFRRDLFYRLNVFPIEAPPLRARLDDVPRLAAAFLARSAERLRQKPRSLSPEALAVLTAYDWPGNVRELENVIERAAIVAQGARIAPEDLPLLRRRTEAKPAALAEVQPKQADDTVPPAGELRAVERAYIEQVLHDTRGVIEGPTGAAARLGLKPSTLRSRMVRLGIRRG